MHKLKKFSDIRRAPKLSLVPPDSPFLKLTTKPVEHFNKVLKEEVDEMIALMLKEQGIGLAAPQVGLDKSMFVIDVPFATMLNGHLIKSTYRRTMINPELTLEGEDISIAEGCLSYPGKKIKVPRKQICKVKYQNVFGNWVSEEFNNLVAIVIQHENQHLQGKTILDYESV